MATATDTEEVIDRHVGLSYDDFARDYMFPNKPVVISGAVDHWRAMKEWSPDWFRRNFGTREVPITTGGKSRTYTIADLVDLVEASSAAQPAPYLRNADVATMFPELTGDYQPLPAYLQPNWLGEEFLAKPLQNKLERGARMELFIGGKGAGFPKLHYDSMATHAFLIQVWGEKRVIFFTPDDTPYLYQDPTGGTYSLIGDVERVDPEQFPLFSRAQAFETTIGPGDLLFIPSFWWHTTKMLSPSISLSVNQLNSSNWHNMIRYLCDKRPAWRAGPMRAYLKAAGHWRIRRDHRLYSTPHRMTGSV